VSEAVCDGLVLFDVPEGRVLVDTGSPYSFGDLPSVRLCGKDFPLSRSRLLADIRRQTVPDLVALLGMDVLCHFDLLFTKSSVGRLQVAFLEPGSEAESESQAFPGRPPTRHPVSLFLGGVPSIRLSIEGTEHACLLDTGAHIQYVPNSVVTDRTPCGHRKDFLPGQGEFDTPLYLLDVTVANQHQRLEFGTLPEIFEFTMSRFGRDWAILGTDFLRANLKDSIRLERNSLTLS
jgi:hypothetical protein